MDTGSKGTAEGEPRPDLSEPRPLYLPDRILVAVSDGLDAITTFAAVIATIAFAAVMLLGVFCRYVLNSSLSWSDEAALVLFGWAAFLFIASAYLHGKHIHLDILVRQMSAAWQTKASTLAEGLAGGYLIALLIACIQAMEVVAKGRTDALQLPMSLHFIAIPVAVSVMMVHWIRRNASGASLQTTMVKLGIAVAYFCIVFAPVGKYVQLTGWLRLPILVLALFGPMLIGVPVALSLGLMATLYVALVGNISFMTGGLQVFNGVTFYALLAIPLLILSGKLMYSAGIAKLLVDFAQVLVGRIRGGLGASNVVASFIFGDISGSAVSDTAAIGAVMVPQMKQRGYHADFCAALQGAAGTLGMTAPLSITVLLYSAAANTSVSRLAAATILPSLLLAASFIALVVWHARRHGYPREVVPSAQIIPRTLRAMPGLFALVLVVTGILGGVFTPAEVGTILLAYVLLLSIFLYRVRQPRVLYEACVEAGHITGMTIFMVCASGFVGFVMAHDLVSVHLVDAISQISMNRYFVLLILSAVLIVLGMFLEPPAIIFGFLPTIMPLLMQANIDLIHWGVLIAINMGLGCIVPPVALNLFVSTQLAGVQYAQAVRAAIPFMVIMAIDLAIVAVYPTIALLLPHLLFGYPIR
jgi:C4-dicarboxylate transporter DctM subunit